MSKQGTVLMALACLAADTVFEYRCISYSNALTNSVGGEVKGISQRPASIGEGFEVAILGTSPIETGGVFGVGAALVSDASGRVIAASAVAVGVGTLAVAGGAVAVTSAVANGVGSIVGAASVTGCELPQHLVGYALQASSGAGAFVEVKLAS
jgi:hypothetical protein